MNVKIRAFLFLIALSFVGTAGPALVLYAQGYRYNFNKHKIEQTGVMFVKSYPRSATISINEQVINKRTPTEVPNLLPATYRVVISKDGYTPWQKQLTVQPKQTTFMEDVTLFKSQPEIKTVLNETVKQSLCAVSDHKLATISNNKLTIVDATRNKILNQTEINEKTEIVNWSANSLNLIIKETKGYYIYSPDSQIKKIVAYNKTPLTDVIWENNSDTNVYGKVKNKLYKYNFSNDKAELYNDLYDWQAVQPMNDLYIGIHQIQNKTYLSTVKGKTVSDIMAIPTGNNYQLNILNDKYLLLINRDFDTAYLINPTDTSNPLHTYMNNVKKFSWLNDTLLYWNEHEINVYHVPSKTKQTIERTSAQISNAAWHNGLVNIFAVIDNKLKIYELDNRDKRNIFDYQDLGSVNELNSTICFSKNGDELFANYNTDDKKGIYRLVIQ